MAVNPISVAYAASDFDDSDLSVADDPSTTTVAQAKPGTTNNQVASNTGGNDFFDTLGRVVSAGLPDALVYSNAAMLAPANAKSFFLANPISGSYTHFISHPQDTVTVGGMPFGRVEAIHYNSNGTGTRREDGFGYVQKFGSGRDTVTVFLNGRLGDTNLLTNPSNGASVNFGFFGSPAAMQQFIDKLPSGGRTGAFKEGLERLLQASAVGGNMAGVAWRSSLALNRDTGVLELNVSGVKIPLADFMASMKEISPINHGAKPVARVNNEEAYLQGANPFQRADDTRTGSGTYVNHGDPVAAISGDILSLRNRLEPSNLSSIRTNDEARRFLEYAIERSTWLTPEQARRLSQLEGMEGAKVDPNPMSAEDKTKLQSLLVQLDQYGLYFGSAKIETAAREATSRQGAAVPVDADSRAFVRDVFEGTFRYQYNDSYSSADLARDVILGVSRWGVLFGDLLAPQGLARDDINLAQWRNTQLGFERRMQLEGGTLGALGLTAPSGASRGELESQATAALAQVLSSRLQQRDVAVSAESLYSEFKSMPSSQRTAIARQIQSSLALSSSATPSRVGDRHLIDGVTIVGDRARLESVGGVNRRTGQALQGDLMWGRTESGSPVFWLQGQSTNYLLRDAQGGAITNQTDAQTRARELINGGAATDLRALDRRYLTSQPTSPSSPPSTTGRVIDGITIVGDTARVESVGGVNRSTGQALQGDLMWGRTESGSLVFWLRGVGTNYILRDTSGALIGNQSEAEARARVLINNGGATDLRPLDSRFLQ